MSANCLLVTFAAHLGGRRGLVEFVRFYHAIGKTTWTKVERIFDTFYRLMDSPKDPVKETVLIAVGSVGKYASDTAYDTTGSIVHRVTDNSILGVAISCLIAQLGRPSPIVKGLAYMQVNSTHRFMVVRTDIPHVQ